MRAYADASKAVFSVFEDTTPIVEGLSIDEAFLDVGGLRRVSGTPREIAVRLRHRVAERVGLPITVGVARTKFLAKVASAVAKPDGLLVVPPSGELAFLHPLPVERLWGVGRVTAGKLRRRGIVTVGDLAALPEGALVAMVGGGAGRHLHALAHNRDPRAVDVGRRRRSIGSQQALGRGRRPGGHRRGGRRPGRPGDAAPAHGPAGGSHGGAAPAVRRLRAGDAVAHPCRGHGPHGHDPRRGAGAAPSAAPVIEARGLSLVGISVGNLDDDRAVQLALPFDRRAGPGLDLAIDAVRERFGAGAVTRVVHLGREVGPTVPLLPD